MSNEQQGDWVSGRTPRDDVWDDDVNEYGHELPVEEWDDYTSEQSAPVARPRPTVVEPGAATEAPSAPVMPGETAHGDLREDGRYTETHDDVTHAETAEYYGDHEGGFDERTAPVGDEHDGIVVGDDERYAGADRESAQRDEGDGSDDLYVERDGVEESSVPVSEHSPLEPRGDMLASDLKDPQFDDVTATRELEGAEGAQDDYQVMDYDPVQQQVSPAEEFGPDEVRDDARLDEDRHNDRLEGEHDAGRDIDLDTYDNADDRRDGDLVDRDRDGQDDRHDDHATKAAGLAGATSTTAAKRRDDDLDLDDRDRSDRDEDLDGSRDLDDRERARDLDGDGDLDRDLDGDGRIRDDELEATQAVPVVHDDDRDLDRDSEHTDVLAPAAAGAGGGAAIAGIYRDGDTHRATESTEVLTATDPDLDEREEERRREEQLEAERRARAERLGVVETSRDNEYRPAAVKPKRVTDKFFGSLGLFLLRLVTAVVLGVTAYSMLSPVGTTADILEPTLIPEPRLVSWIVGFTLAALAVLLVLGLFTRLVGFLILAYAVCVLVFLRWGSFNPFGQNFLEALHGDKELLLAGIGVLLLTLGGGGWGIDGWFRRSRARAKAERMA